MDRVSTFPHTRKSRPGYNVDEVDAFLRKARQAYDGIDRVSLSSDDIRHTAFGMRKGGYATAEVDVALERLEDAFASRERDLARRSVGERQWLDTAREDARQIVARLDRPVKRRFRHTGILSLGYSIRQVDDFAERLKLYFHDGKPLNVNDVRAVVFQPQRGGYREAQVDLLLDSVTKVMLAVR